MWRFLSNFGKFADLRTGQNAEILGPTVTKIESKWKASGAVLQAKSAFAALFAADTARPNVQVSSLGRMRADWDRPQREPSFKRLCVSLSMASPCELAVSSCCTFIIQAHVLSQARW